LLACSINCLVTLLFDLLVEVIVVAGVVVVVAIIMASGWHALPHATVAPGSLSSSFTCIVTGANSGIGFATALALARGGARVILACRDESKAQLAAQSMQHETGNQSIETQQLDLQSMSSTRAFVDAFRARNIALHLLVCNAGVAMPSHTLGHDGFEATWSVNHFNTFLLVRLLLPLLVEQTLVKSRIVIVNSGSHRIGWRMCG
jgi:NAD(P)-dependent dehydrogenase (short-subunit alcohol dehydrogenase family)